MEKKHRGTQTKDRDDVPNLKQMLQLLHGEDDPQINPGVRHGRKPQRVMSFELAALILNTTPYKL